jgi:hypothetical protein
MKEIETTRVRRKRVPFPVSIQSVTVDGYVPECSLMKTKLSESVDGYGADKLHSYDTLTIESA